MEGYFSRGVEERGLEGSDGRGGNLGSLDGHGGWRRMAGGGKRGNLRSLGMDGGKERV